MGGGISGPQDIRKASPSNHKASRFCHRVRSNLVVRPPFYASSTHFRICEARLNFPDIHPVSETSVWGRKGRAWSGARARA